jgi:hypothetical protein
MGLFDFVSGWKEKLIDRPLDARMAETLKVGLAVARNEVHVISGYLQSTIGGEYDRSTKTIKLHADAPYALIEEARAPLGAHSYLAPAANEMARLWGGSRFELHYPNAAIGRDKLGLARNRQREARVHSGFTGGRRGVAQRVTIHSRRWRKWAAEIPGDPTTPVL